MAAPTALDIITNTIPRVRRVRTRGGARCGASSSRLIDAVTVALMILSCVVVVSTALYVPGDARFPNDNADTITSAGSEDLTSVDRTPVRSTLSAVALPDGDRSDGYDAAEQLSGTPETSVSPEAEQVTAENISVQPRQPGESAPGLITMHLVDDPHHPLVPKVVLPVDLPIDVADVELTRRP